MQQSRPPPPNSPSTKGPNQNQNQGPPSSTAKPKPKPKPKSTAKLPPSGVPFGHLPAFLPGSASLVEQLDRRIMIVLRDGRHLVGVLRSFDQFSNMVMEDTSERRVLNVKVSPVEDGAGSGEKGSTICYYTDIQLGLYLVRGDSMVLLGEVEVEHDGNDNDDGDRTSGETKEAGDVADGNMIGSGLLGGPQKNVIEEKKKYMKEVTLEEFERLVEEHQKADGDVDGAGSNGKDGAGAVEQLTWEFDTDLYV